MKTSLVLSLVAAAALAGCHTATTLPDARDQPTCTAGPDCTAKWEAARAWVKKNISFPLTMDGALLLQTTGPIPVGIENPMRLAATVKLVPIANEPQRFRIVATIGCGNPFGCVPLAPDALQDFNHTVNGAK